MSKGPILKAYNRHRYAILFYSLLVSIVAVPLFSQLKFSLTVLAILFAFNLLAAITPIESRRLRWLLVAVVLLSFIGEWIPYTQKTTLHAVGIPVWATVAMMAAFYALRFTLRARFVRAEQLYAALSAYLMAGIFLGDLYFAIERAWPGSFAFNGAPMQDFEMSTAVYFSFVTLATLGYGDIVPRSEIARALTIVEAVAGQLYLAVMVARLVSSYVSSREFDKTQD